MKADRNWNTLRQYTSETQCFGTAGETGAKAEPSCGAGLVECMSERLHDQTNKRSNA